MGKLQRRGFLKALAAVLPASVLAKGISEAAEVTPKPAPQVRDKTAKVSRPSSLKADRYIQSQYCAGFCDCPAEKGMVIEIAKFLPCLMGGQYPVVRPGSHSGQPLGILLEDVVQLDLSRVPASHLCSNNAVQVGSKVTVCQDGWLMVGPFDDEVYVGQRIYYNNAGRLTTRHTGQPIGVALSGSDADGFVKIKVNLYVNEKAELPSPIQCAVGT